MLWGFFPLCLEIPYIALFSHFIPCGVYEAVYILDGLLNNKSDIQPDTIHGDTQAQSEAVFGLSYLLGIKLMPRIRRMKHLKYYRADKKDRYKHIDELFSDTIKWELIEKYLPDMLRIALSIKAGKITASTVLRRLGTYSRKNKLYLALRELGRVVRTVFLLQYIAEAELRQLIQAATCKSEEFNDFVQWVLFGGEGVIAENLRHEQRKIIKYNHLVANLLILYNVSAMTETIGELFEKGYRIDGKILAGLAPFRKGHINRFGNYVMNIWIERSSLSSISFRFWRMQTRDGWNWIIRQFCNVAVYRRNRCRPSMKALLKAHRGYSKPRLDTAGRR